MREIPSIVYKCLKFPLNEKIITINHSMYQPTMRHGGVNLDYFWSKQFELLKPRSDALFKSYQRWRNEMILYLSKLRDPNPIPLLHDRPIPPPIPPPHDGPILLPILSIPPLYVVVPPPTYYKGKRPTSPNFQPKKYSPMHPSLKEENKSMPSDPKLSQPSCKTKRNHCLREHLCRRCAKARELSSQPISSLKNPNVNMIPLVQPSPNPREEAQPKSPRRKMIKKNNGSCSIPIKDPIFILDEEMDENDVHANNVDDNDEEYEYVDVDNNLSKQFSQELILAPSNRHSDLSLEHGRCLELVVAQSTMLEIAPLAYCLDLPEIILSKIGR